MKRLISINDRDSYTLMLEILDALNIPGDYKWLITGVEAWLSYNNQGKFRCFFTQIVFL